MTNMKQGTLDMCESPAGSCVCVCQREREREREIYPPGTGGPLVWTDARFFPTAGSPSYSCRHR